jgi:hypothetical protein
MNQPVPLSTLLIAAFGILILYGSVRGASIVVASARRTAAAMEVLQAVAARLVEALDRTAAADTKLMEATTSSAKDMAIMPPLLEAVTKLGHAQLELLERQRHPFRPPNNNPLPPRDVEAANQEAEIAEIMRSYGVTREEPLLRMNSANGTSVWEGDVMFRNWGGR